MSLNVFEFKSYFYLTEQWPQNWITAPYEEARDRVNLKTVRAQI